MELITEMKKGIRLNFIVLILFVGGALSMISAAIAYQDETESEEVQTTIPLFYLNPEEEGKVLLEDEFGNSTTSDIFMNCDNQQCLSQMSLSNGDIFEYHIKVVPQTQMQLEVELQLTVIEGSAEIYVSHAQIGRIKGIPYEDGQLVVIDKSSLVQGMWHVVVEAWGNTPITADLIVQSSFIERDINETDVKVLQSLQSACCTNEENSNSKQKCQVSSYNPAALNHFNLRRDAGWCQKPGQLCDRNGHVVKLDLSVDDLPFSQRNGENCSMAPYIQQLPQFTSLLLNDETQKLRLTDILGSVTELEKLNNLRYLSLNNVKLQSTQPQYFCRLKNLEYLSLSGTGLRCFQDCFSGSDSKLHYLDLSSNQLGVDCFFKFGQYPGLRHLDLSQNPDIFSDRDMVNEGKLQDGAESHNLDYVEYLNLSDCSLANFDALIKPGNLSSLKILDMSDNQINGNLEELAQRKRLQYLDLSQNQIKGSIPDSLSGLQALYHLDLSQNQLSGNIPSAIDQLPRLQYLNLEKNQFVGEIPGNLSSKQVLEELRLGYNNFTGTINHEILEFKSLQILELQQNQLQGTLNLAKLGWLESEALSPQLPHTDIGIDEGGDALNPSPPLVFPPTERKSLVHFNASYNNLLDFVENGIPQNMGLFQSKVQTIDLSHNNIKGTLPQILLGFRELSSLNLSDNFLEGPLAWLFSQMGDNELKELNLARNQLSGTIPNEVTKMSAFDSYGGGELLLQSNNLKGLLNKKLVDKGMYKITPDYWPQYAMWVNISDNSIYCQPHLADFENIYYGINQFTCTDPDSSEDVKKEVSLIDYMLKTTLMYNVQKLECRNEFNELVEQQYSPIFKDGYNCSVRVLQNRDMFTLFMLRLEGLTRPVQLNLDKELQLSIKYLGIDVQQPVPEKILGPLVLQGTFGNEELGDKFIQRPGWWMFLVRNKYNRQFHFTFNIASLQPEDPLPPPPPIEENYGKNKKSDKIKNENSRTEDNSNNDNNNKNGTSKFQMSLEFIIAIILVLLVLFLIACVSYVCRRMLMNRARLVMIRGNQQRAEALDQNQIQLVQEINRMHGQRLLDRLPTYFFLRETDENIQLNGVESDESAETASNGVGDCAICLEKFQDSNEVTTLPCCHQFHSECIGPWVRTKGKFADCPICKAKIYELLISQQNNAQTPPPPDPDPEEV